MRYEYDTQIITLLKSTNTQPCLQKSYLHPPPHRSKRKEAGHNQTQPTIPRLNAEMEKWRTASQRARNLAVSSELAIDARTGTGNAGHEGRFVVADMAWRVKKRSRIAGMTDPWNRMRGKEILFVRVKKSPLV